MMCVAALAFMFGKDIPQPMQFAMLAQQMLAAQMFGMYVPHAHDEMSRKLPYIFVDRHYFYPTAWDTEVWMILKDFSSCIKRLCFNKGIHHNVVA